MAQTEIVFQKNPQSLSKQDIAEIYELLSLPLFRYAVRLLGDPDLAEDCVAETFNKFLNALQRGVGPRENLKAYLYRIAHNWITDYYRRRSPEENLETDRIDDSLEHSVVMDTDSWERQQIRQALLQLPEAQRQVVLLRFFEEWSHEEIATATGKTIEATRALQYRALNGLRNLLVTAEI